MSSLVYRASSKTSKFIFVNTESPQIKAATCMAYALSAGNLNVYSCFKRF